MSNSNKKTKKSEDNLSDLSQTEKKLIDWLSKKGQCSLEDVVNQILPDPSVAQTTLDSLKQKKLLKSLESDGNLTYKPMISTSKKGGFIDTLLKSIERKIAPVNFKNLVILTFITALILTPFVFSPIYISILREWNFDLHQFFQGDLYKQTTGYIGLFFVFLEMILTVRKRGRGWWLKISIPGSIILWRSLHIFIGVAMLGVILIHTIGSRGLNFNGIFLWVFFGVILSAVIGSVAETGVLESPRRFFGSNPEQKSNNIIEKFLPIIPKGKLIKILRNFWLSSHIFLVNVFFVMLIFHIFLAYYYQ